MHRIQLHHSGVLRRRPVRFNLPPGGNPRRLPGVLLELLMLILDILLCMWEFAWESFTFFAERTFLECPLRVLIAHGSIPQEKKGGNGRAGMLLLRYPVDMVDEEVPLRRVVRTALILIFYRLAENVWAFFYQYIQGVRGLTANLFSKRMWVYCTFIRKWKSSITFRKIINSISVAFLSFSFHV